MKTDLSSIITVAGHSGLYKILTRNRSGVIVEQLSTGKRTVFGLSARITSLGDISIYTDGDDLPLKELLEKMHAVLADEEAPSQKSDPEVLKEFFLKACPNYDGDRFYVSHMKKCVEWYNELKRFASLEFGKEDEEEEAAAAAETPAEGTPAEEKKD